MSSYLSNDVLFGLEHTNSKFYRIEFPSKYALVEENLMKHVEVMLGQSSVDFFLRKP